MRKILFLLTPALLVILIDALVQPFQGTPAVPLIAFAAVFWVGDVLLFPSSTNLLGMSRTPTLDVWKGVALLIYLALAAVCGVWAVL